MAAPLKRVDNPADKCWAVLKGRVLWDLQKMEEAAPLKRVGNQTNSKREKFRKPLRQGAAAVARRSGGAVERSVYYLVFLLFFFVVAGWKYGKRGPREGARAKYRVGPKKMASSPYFR